jgi:uncharacterized protein (TIGR03067 family)
VETQLEGKWQMLRAEMAGEVAPELLAARTEVRLGAGVYEVWFGGERADRGSYREDEAAAGFRTLTLTGTDGQNAGRVIRGIFQLMGNRLRVCYGLDGQRPDDFSTRQGDQRYLATYRRILVD